MQVRETWAGLKFAGKAIRHEFSPTTYVSDEDRKTMAALEQVDIAKKTPTIAETETSQDFFDKIVAQKNDMKKDTPAKITIDVVQGEEGIKVKIVDVAEVQEGTVVEESIQHKDPSEIPSSLPGLVEKDTDNEWVSLYPKYEGCDGDVDCKVRIFIQNMLETQNDNQEPQKETIYRRYTFIM